MVRGAFSNPKLGNRVRLRCSVHAASVAYRRDGVPLLVIAGAAYGTGSSRDWAAKVTALSGVRAVLAESFERIHRSNLVAAGVLPLEFTDGQNADRLGLDGTETYDVLGIREGLDHVTVVARRTGGETVEFGARVRLDTPLEADYYRHGGLLPLVYRKLTEGQPS
jgi:aconitate hydratase